MKDKKFHIVYVISLLEKSIAFECIAVALQKRYKLTFILLNPKTSPLEEFLVKKSIEIKRIKFSGKSDYPRAFLSLFIYLLRTRPQVIHAHLLDAQLLALSAAWLARVPKRIYTRHNSTFHHVYNRSGLKYDKWSNALATHIVSISQATDYTLTKLEKVQKVKVRKIHHGFQLSAYQNANPDRVRALKFRWDIAEKCPVIGVIARHIEWKGIQYIIPAFARLLNEYPSAVLILANAQGPFHGYLMKLLALLPKSSFRLIPFENDIVSLYGTFDLYVHVPIDPLCEAFGQTYVEALAAQVPSVFSKSGVAVEFIEHTKNAWVVNFCDSDEIYDGLITLLKDANLRDKFKREGRESVKTLFELEKMTGKLEALYEE